MLIRGPCQFDAAVENNWPSSIRILSTCIRRINASLQPRTFKTDCAFRLWIYSSKSGATAHSVAYCYRTIHRVFSLPPHPWLAPVRCCCCCCCCIVGAGVVHRMQFYSVTARWSGTKCLFLTRPAAITASSTTPCSRSSLFSSRVAMRFYSALRIFEGCLYISRILIIPLSSLHRSKNMSIFHV